MDGNFHLDRKRANGEGEYNGLWDGAAYFPRQSDFLKYLSMVIDEPSASIHDTPHITTRANLVCSSRGPATLSRF